MLGHPSSIDRMYPRVPVALLVCDEWQKRFHQYFVEAGEFAADPFQVSKCTKRPHKKCISVCFFKQNVNNRVRNEFPVDEDLWRCKYWLGLLNLARDMCHFPDWKLRVYLEAQLWDETYSLLNCSPQIELFRMSVNSVGACPGMLWRLMALADSSLDIALVTDIDESLMQRVDSMRSFEMDIWSCIGRIGDFVSNRKFLIAQNESTAKNYDMMLGSCIMSRPPRFDFDLIAAMRGFMAYRRYYSTSSRPWAYDDLDLPSVYNQSIGAHIYGWGSHWYMYGFDERFLKHVMYYHFAEKGLLHTWVLSPTLAQPEPEGRCDLEYLQSHDNTTVSPYTTVRLASLGLTPKALQIALVLEEHRWIFENLTELVRRHSQNGICGNLFFHNIADPFFIKLVPKQLNLFEASRHASKAIEIGFGAGHSAAIMLLANPRLTLRAFDTCGLAYTEPSIDFLNEVFSNRITVVKGYSQITVSADVENGYDLVHIDADHCYHAVAADLANSLPKCVLGAIVVLDDYEARNEVAQAALQRADLTETHDYTVTNVFPGSSHAIFHYTRAGADKLLSGSSQDVHY